MSDASLNPGMQSSPILTTILLGSPEGMPSIAPDLMPLLPSPWEDFTVLKLDTDDQYEANDIIAVRGEMNQIETSVGSSITGKVVERGLKTVLSDREIEQARRRGEYARLDGVASIITNLELQATMTIRNRVLKGREVRSAAIITTQANYDSGLVGSSGLNLATDDVVAAVQTAQNAVYAASGLRPMDLEVSYQAYQALINNPLIRARVLGVTGGIVSDSQLAATLGVKKIHVGYGQYSTISNATRTRHDIWPSTSMSLLYVPPLGPNGLPQVQGASKVFGVTYTVPYDGFPQGGAAAFVPGVGGVPGYIMLGMTFQERITEARTAYYYKERYKSEAVDGTTGYFWPGIAIA